MVNVKNVLAYTNPIGWVPAIGVLCAVILKNLFGGVYKDCKKILKELDD